MVAHTSNECSDPVQHYFFTDATLRFEIREIHPVLRCKKKLNWETVSRSTINARAHGLFEFIRPFRLRKQLCLTRSRWVFESYAWAVRALRSNIGAYQFARLQGTNVIRIFLCALCDRVPVALLRLRARNQCDPDFLLLSLNRTGPDRFYALCLRTNIGRLVIIEKHNSIQPFFLSKPGKSCTTRRPFLRKIQGGTEL